MKFVITLGDAVELAFVALVLCAFALAFAVERWRERKRNKGGRK